MAVIGTAEIELRPDTGRFAKQAEDDVGGKIPGIAKKAAAIFAGAFVVERGVSFLSGIIKDATESNLVLKQSEAVIRSTGGAANITAGQMSSLATAISNKTGIDDEAIQSAENLLATFTSVRNETGKGRDIFNQASRALVDMGAALGGDPKSSAIQLGKALNDPINGITALTRVGVTFTQGQKDQIAAMVKAGDVAGAQGVILAELNKEFGGSAESQATAGKKLSIVWGNVREQLGGYLLPVFDKVASWLAERLPGAIDTAVGVIGPFAQKVRLLVEAFVSAFSGEGITESSGIFNLVERLGVGLRALVGGVKAFVYSLTTGFTEDEGTPIERIALVIRDIALPAFQAITSWVKDHMTVSLVGLGVAVALLVGPVVGTVAAVAALAAGVVVAYNRFSAFRTVVDAVVSFFSTAVIPAVGAVVSYVTEQVGHLATWWRANWEDIQAATENVLKALVIVVALAVAPFVFIWQQAGDQILAILTVLWDQVRLVIETGVRIVRDIVTFFLALLSGDWGKAWNAIKDVPVAIFDFLVGTVGHAVELLWQVVQGGLNILGGIWSAGWEAIKSVATTVLRNVVDFFLGIVDELVQGGAKAFGWVPGIGGKLKDAAAEFAQFRDNVNAALGGIHDKVVNVTVRGVDRHLDLNNPGSFDVGGWVPGPVGAPKVILAHGGEFVLSRDMLSGRSGGAAAPLSAPAGPTVSVDISMPGLATSPEARKLIEQVARGEFTQALTRVLDAAAAGAGARGA